jgi:cytochrome c556
VGFRVYAGVVLFGATAVVAGAQKITTPEELDKIMKKSGPAMQATQKAVGAGSFAEARKQMATVKQAVVDSNSFWVEHKREDAVKFNKDTVAKIDEFEKVLSADKVDPATAAAALKEVGASCRACHKVYRATDAEENFILKPGSIG